MRIMMCIMTRSGHYIISYVWRFYFFAASPLFCSHTYTYAHPSLSTTASLLSFLVMMVIPTEKE